MELSDVLLENLNSAQIENLRLLARAKGLKRRAADGTSIPQVTRDGPLPLSFAQRGLWFLSRDEQASVAYHISLALRLSGELDRVALRRSLNALVARHEALRSVFVAGDGEPHVRHLPPDIGCPVVEHDLRAESDATARITQISAEEMRTPFDLTSGPLIRARLVRVDEDEHLLLVTQHHLASDGWSEGIFARELRSLYGAFREGRDNPLPTLPIQYADYAAWQRSWLNEERLERQGAYWRETLAGAPALLELPTDRPRPARQSFAGAYVPLRLDRELTRSLKTLSARHGVTLFMTLLTAWAVVLSRLSGQKDLVIGIPTANRQQPETVGVIGCFINTLALHLDLDSTPRVEDLLARVRETALAAHDHQDLPFDQVVEAVQPPRRSSHSPLFQVMFSWQPERRLLKLQGLRVKSARTTYDVARHDLKLDLAEQGDGIAGGLIYSTALFDEATIVRHRAYLQTVLRAMVADSTQPLAGIDIIGPDELRLLADMWGGPVLEAEAGSLPQLFEAQVRATPDAPAVTCDGQALSYAALNAEANRLAHHLIGIGLQPEERVAICVERSLGMVIGLLAILKSGGAYVPLDPTYPSERLRQVLSDADCRVALSDAAGRAALGTSGEVSLDLTGLGTLGAPPSIWAAQSPANLDRLVSPAHLAYVLYTSGSTGTPKGVLVEHRSVTNFHAALQRTIYPAGAPRRIGWNASFAFDMSLKGLVRLLSGDTLVIIPQAVRASGPALLAFLQDEAIDAFDTTPSQLKTLIGAGLLADPALRTVLLGGEAVDAAMWAQLQGAVALTVHNMYGPTECTVDATIGRVLAGDGGPHIGRPIVNTQIYLLDETRRPAPLGATGEIYIGGAGVARGYWRRQDVTSERFLLDPFSGEPHARMYKTGDLARYRSDGTLQYLGRNDQQVKIRGFRIELGEIESRLREQPTVREAVVVVQAESPDEPRLVAYVQAQAAPPADWGGLLRTALAAALPDYMLPAAFVPVEAWPLTSNGKLNRAALPAPDESAFAHRTYEAPAGEVEVTLAAVWQELLGVDRVGRHDHFFELGGHSLLAVQLLVRVRQMWSIEVPMATLFARPTLTQLAALLTAADVPTGDAPLTAIPIISRQGPLPLSFAQQRLWFLAQLDQSSPSYYIPTAVRLHGELDRAALRRSLDALVGRHEALRSVFVVRDGGPTVVLLPPDTGCPMVEHDLRQQADAAQQVAAISLKEAYATFDLSRGPLIRAQLLRVEDQTHVLLVTQHHIVSDGWSLRIFADELTALYRAFAAGAPSPLRPLAIQYPDYAAWQRQWLSGDRLQQQTEYWREALAGVPALLELPTDRPRPAQQSSAGAHVPITLDRDITQALKTLSAQQGSTLFMILAAAWSVVLARLSGQDDLVIGIPTANRARPETDGVIGFFVNTLALRVDLAGAPSVADLVARVRARSVAAHDHQDLPFEQVVEIVQPPRRLNQTPLFQVMFSWQNDERTLPQLSGLSVQAERMPYYAAKFDLRLDLIEQGDTLVGGLFYATALFDEATILRHRGYLQKVLHAMVADPAQPVTQIDLIGTEERAWLDAWNATTVPYESERCIHELFEAQVRRTPDATAVMCRGQALSYAELNAAANRLAHHLIDLGVRPDARVAICVERSAGMIVGVLAIVKAGGAYIPLDPGYPAPRLREIVTDAAPALVLVDAIGRAALGADALLDRLVVDLEPLRPGATEQPVWAARPVTNVEPRHLGLTAGHRAYVIYTSGSTGTPKGAIGLHRPVINLIEWITRECQVGPGDVLLLTSSLSFDLSVYDIFGVLAVGGCIRVATPEEMADPRQLTRILFNEPITFWDSAPAVFQQVIFNLDDAEWQGREPSLRLAFFSGDWIPIEFFDKLRRFFPRCRMVALGGATEATVWSNYFNVDRVDPTWGSIPYGRPIQNARYYVLDTHLNPSPKGARGDLYIGGDCLTAGYWNRPTLTAERFLDDPFSGKSDGRMYKTGDLSRYRPDGNLEFLGRSDHQVKIRGFRIELGEIEARLGEHPAVGAALVLAREDTPGEKRLVAYLVPASGHEGSELLAGGEWAGVLRAYLAARLPEYMVPAAFVPIAEMPLTPNGKLDRAALPAPDGDAFVRRAYEAPQGEIEETLGRLWQELLGVDRVGRHDHFFELGGHSLLAVQLIDRLRSLDLQLEIRALFTESALSEVASHIEALEEFRIDAAVQSTPQ